MTTPANCPKCGADTSNYTVRGYICGSGYCDDGRFAQSGVCIHDEQKRLLGECEEALGKVLDDFCDCGRDPQLCEPCWLQREIVPLLAKLREAGVGNG